jgi:hypothetical protein
MFPYPVCSHNLNCDYIKMHLKEMGWKVVDRNHRVQGREEWRTLANMGLMRKLGISCVAEHLSASQELLK